jgi:hypothetical protein
MHPRGTGYYLGCQKDLLWMKQTRDILCEESQLTKEEKLDQLEQVDLPKVFYFSFDGAADFNADRALNLDPTIANLSGDEGKDLYAGNFNGGRNILEHILKNNQGHTYENRYYAGSGFHKKENYKSAFRCINHIDEYLDVLEELDIKNYKKPLMVTIGYSNGGIDSLYLQHAMPKKLNRSIDLILTVDPIAKAVKYIPSKLWTYAGEKSKKTSIHLNFFQKVDYMSLGTYVTVPVLEKFYIGFKFKGKPVLSADLNHEFTLKNNSKFEMFEGAYAHVTITGSHTIWETFQCNLDKLLTKKDMESIPSCQTENVLR